MDKKSREKPGELQAKALDPEVTSILQSFIKEKISVEIQEQYSGPIPKSSELTNYEKALPGSADRIITMAEKEQANGHIIQAKTLAAQSKDSTLSIASAFLVVASVLFLIYTAMIENMPWVAVALGGTTIVSLATVFMKGKKKKH